MTDTQPMDWLTRLILIFVSFTLGFLTVGQPSRSVSGVPDTDTARPSVEVPIGVAMNGQPMPSGASLHLIESVEILVMESFPMQIALNLTGYIPDGCTAPTQVVQSRDGEMVMVRVFRTLPPETMCAAMAAVYNDTIQLEGGFTSGHYTFDVNGVIVEIDL